MDPLSDVLSLLRLRTVMAGSFDAGGDWSIAFGAHEGLKVYATVSGACWLAVEGVPGPVRVHAGDCLLLPRGLAFRVASDLALPPDHGLVVGSWGSGGGVTRLNDGGDVVTVGGHFALAGDHAALLSGLLPPLIHIRNEAESATLRWCVERMAGELSDPRPGGDLVVRQLVTTILVEALRLHLLEADEGRTGWLFALADARMAVALTAMHSEPGRRWTVQGLAERAAMSRTSFALRFRATVGVSPMEYLSRWRMRLAADRLAISGEPVSIIAPSLGYQSDSAFGAAFKRVMGCSPQRYGRDRDAKLES